MDTLFIFGAKYLFLLSIVVAGIYFLKQPREQQKKILMFGLIALVSIFIVALIASHVYYNPRPFVVGNFTPLIPHVADNGFPSDHALLVSAIAAIIYVFNRRVGLWLWLVALLVAISRVYVGVHHPLDVIVSMIIAAGVTMLVYYCLKNILAIK